MITLKLLVWIAYISFDVWINYRIIEVNKRRPRYLLLNIMRGSAFVLYGRLVWDMKPEIWYLNVLLFCVTSFWIGFDSVLNLTRGKHMLYIGPQSGWIDKWGVSNPVLYYLCKFFALIILVLATINIFAP
jgi:hypothetical protein